MNHDWERREYLEEEKEFCRIQALDRAMKIPGVHYLWDKSAEVYGRVKCSNGMLHRALDTFEEGVSLLMQKTALPVVRLMEKPIFTLDRTLCQGLDLVQVKLPAIREEPKRILDRTKLIVLESIGPAFRTFKELKEGTEEYVSVIKIRTLYKVHYLRSYSWRQADRVMSTDAGVTILKTLDETAELAELLLDKYLPAPDEEEPEDYSSDSEEECAERDNLHHTMIRLSEFSSRASRRIYSALMDRIQHMYKIEIIVLILHAFIIIQVVKVLELLLNYLLRRLNYAI